MINTNKKSVIELSYLYIKGCLVKVDINDYSNIAQKRIFGILVSKITQSQFPLKGLDHLSQWLIVWEMIHVFWVQRHPRDRITFFWWSLKSCEYDCHDPDDTPHHTLYPHTRLSANIPINILEKEDKIWL